MNTKNDMSPAKSAVKRPDKIQNRYLDRSILLSETGSSATIKKVIMLIGLILAAFIVWANFLNIDEVASTTGKIMHQGDVVKVQHLIGGRVKRVFVQNGAFVNEGETLITLDPLLSRLELESIQIRKQQLEATKIRLTALISGETPDFSTVSNILVRNEQFQLYQNNSKSIELNRNVIINQIEQVKSEILLQNNSREKIDATVVLIKEELDIRNKLRSKGLNTRVTLLQLEKEYNNALYSSKMIPTSIERLRGRQKELNTTLANVTALAQGTFAKELSAANSEVMLLENKIEIFNSNIDFLDIKAPVEGYVHDIRLQAAGEIAKAGDVLLTLIPIKKPLIARVKIASKDIGHIKVGQQTIIRVTTYDSRRYGVLKGKVVKVSPSALIPNDRTAPYYEGIIHLEKNYIGTPQVKMKLFSGMTLTADIKTGSKTLVEYLLKPIYAATKLSFHER